MSEPSLGGSRTLGILGAMMVDGAQRLYPRLSHAQIENAAIRVWLGTGEPLSLIEMDKRLVAELDKIDFLIQQ